MLVLKHQKSAGTNLHNLPARIWKGSVSSKSTRIPQEKPYYTRAFPVSEALSKCDKTMETFYTSVLVQARMRLLLMCNRPAIIKAR
jgi:hypothetical protein